MSYPARAEGVVNMINIFSNSPASYMSYVGLKFAMAEISYLATPVSLDFRVTFIYLLSLFKRLLCRLRLLSLIIFIILISSRLILVLCIFLIWPDEIGVRLIHPCVLYTVKSFSILFFLDMTHLVQMKIQLFKFPSVLYAICRFKTRDSRPKLAT